MFVIEDELHAEPQAGEFRSLADAVADLKRRALVPWDQEPNRAPCEGWRTCGRSYEIVESTPRRARGRGCGACLTSTSRRLVRAG
jgi:hypothetical protein